MFRLTTRAEPESPWDGSGVARVLVSGRVACRQLSAVVISCSCRQVFVVCELAVVPTSAVLIVVVSRFGSAGEKLG